MRHLKTLTDQQMAGRLAAWLEDQGYAVHINDEEPGQVTLWLEDEDRLHECRQALNQAPTDPDKLPRAKPKPKESSGGLPVRRNRRIVLDRGSDNLNLTIGTIAICVVVFMAQRATVSGSPLAELVYSLMYSNRSFPLFYEISNGQIWRLFTPALLHGGFLHLGFNMLWLYQLGGQLETIIGKRHLLFLMLLIAGISNTGEYLLTGPGFGGMSGVVYGLLSFIFLMQRFRPTAGYYLDNGLMGFMLVWLVLCMTGLFGNIANGAHVFGLLSGAAWAWLIAGRSGRTGRA